MRNKGLAQRKRGTGQPATGFRFGTRDPRLGVGLEGDEKKKKPSLPGKRINRSASLQGAPKGVHSWRGWWGEGHRAGPWAQQGGTDGQSISAPRRKSSRAAGVGPGSFVEGVFQQDFCSVTGTTATEPCQGSMQTLLREAPKDSPVYR